MIFDSLKNCKQYYSVNGKFEQAFDFIKKATEENLPVGKYEIDGKELYASVQEYNTKSITDAKFEGHRNYIDIQYIISGIERVDVVDISKATLNSEYNEIKDVEFYKNNDKSNNCVIESGEYGIFLPHDIHKPGIAYNGISSSVKKIVVKVKI